MQFLEKDLEQIIYEAYTKGEQDKLDNRGLFIRGTIKRQLQIGSYGIADLVSFERGYVYTDPMDFFESSRHKSGNGYRLTGLTPTLKITIYELKKDKIGISAYLQGLKYMKGLKQYFKAREWCLESHLIFNLVLIGREVDTDGSFCFIPDLFKNIRFYTYSYGLNGLQFKQEYMYKMVNEGFKVRKKPVKKSKLLNLNY